MFILEAIGVMLGVIPQLIMGIAGFLGVILGA